MSKLYLQNRLYNANGRLVALDLYERVIQWIDDGAFPNMQYPFLPFMTSNNNTCDGEDGIFQMDVLALESCDGVAGYFDGWTYDPGSAFEIGCGYAWGYPIHVITTDIYKSSVGGGDEYYYASKLLEHIATVVAVGDLNQEIKDYRARNEDILNRALTAFKKNLIADFGKPRSKPVRLEKLPQKYDFYIDPNFKYSEQGRMLLDKIGRTLHDASKTFIIGDNQGDIEADLIHLRECGQSIFYFNVAEPNVDTGILQGFAHGVGCVPVVYADNEQRIQMSGKWRIQLNTMNYWCASTVANNFEELKAALVK